MTVEELRDRMSGTVLERGDDGWDAARTFHSGTGDPDLIVRARSVSDVQAAVRYATAEGLAVSARWGGHSAWGTVPGGVALDLSGLDDIEVEAPHVHVGGGATWGHVARALAPHGLGLSSGDTASVGVGGLTLGGGIGWMVRAWGLAVDQLVGAQLVTATGEVLEVDGESHPELFWAIRGGGGNFGIVTRFDFCAHELPSIVWTMLRVTGDLRPVLTTMREVMATAPRDLTVTFMDVPPMDPHAPAGATLSAVWIGDDVEAAATVLAPLRALEGISVVESGVRAYPDILLDMPAADPAQPMPGLIGENILTASLDEHAIELLVSFREAHPASVLFLRSLGGAYGDVPQDDTAFPARTATWFVMECAFDIPGVMDEDERAAALTEWAAVAETGLALYGNFTTTTDQTLLARMYPPATHARLAAVKRVFDPGNVFCRNVNVLPS